jgi:chloramphenicol 3-O-phosphotransferase
MRLIRRAHLFVAWAFVAGVILQVFLAGLGVFDNPATFNVHATWGYTLEILPLALLALAAVGRLGRRQLIYPAALFGMFMLQSIFVALRGDLPMVAAFHPVNGFAILFVGIAMAREAWAAREATESTRAPMPAPGTAGR